MWELYLISRIGTINVVLRVIMMMFLIGSFVFYMSAISTDDWSGEDVWNEFQKSKLVKHSKRSLVVALISLFLVIITPTQKEAYLIYGVGGMIDYVESSDKAREIPDKCIEALDAWVESLDKKKE